MRIVCCCWIRRKTLATDIHFALNPTLKLHVSCVTAEFFFAHAQIVFLKLSRQWFTVRCYVASRRLSFTHFMQLWSPVADFLRARRGKHPRARLRLGRLEGTLAGRCVGSWATLAPSLHPTFSELASKHLQIRGSSPKRGMKTGRELPSSLLSGQPATPLASSCGARPSREQGPIVKAQWPRGSWLLAFFLLHLCTRAQSAQRSAFK